MHSSRAGVTSMCRFLYRKERGKRPRPAYTGQYIQPLRDISWRQKERIWHSEVGGRGSSRGLYHTIVLLPRSRFWLKLAEYRDE